MMPESHLGALRQDDPERHVLDEHVVEDVVDEAHVERVLLPGGEEVLVARHVVPDEVVRLPAAEQWEPGREETYKMTE